MALTLKSGFTFDYDNLFGEGKVTQADLDSYKDALAKAHEAMKVMRENVQRGEIDGYVVDMLIRDYDEIDRVRDEVSRKAGARYFASFGDGDGAT